MLLLTIPIEIFACSAFFSDGESKLLAKNFDWSSGQGYIIKNKKGQTKFAYGLRGSNQAHWTSKYGSITFNQIGKEFPYGGMNEKGLVVEQLWMSESIYQDNGNQSISELEWIQFQLDNYATVDELIQGINKLSIKPIVTVHYFIADQSGNSAVIDFVDAKTIVSRKLGKNQVITNETFLSSESYFEANRLKIDKNSRTHFDRFCQIKNALSSLDVKSPEQAFEILGESAENRRNYKTYWSIVYDLSKLEVHFKSLSNRSLKKIKISDLDFTEQSDLEAFEMNTDSLQLKPYTFEINEKLFHAALKMMNLKMDQSLGAKHQMEPNEQRIDKTFQAGYVNLSIVFQSLYPSGNIYYTIIEGEENFKNKKGLRAGVFSINKLENNKMVYTLPKGNYALACFLDTDLDGKIDKNVLGIPKNFGFSRNNRGLLGTPPKYRDANIDIKEDSEILVTIR